jgi:hypothetical protein
MSSNAPLENSRAVTDLNSTYRWCLTGYAQISTVEILADDLSRFYSTPIINGLSDAYPLFRFLQIRPWYDWTEFHGNVSKIERRNREWLFLRPRPSFNCVLMIPKSDPRCRSASGHLCDVQLSSDEKLHA